MANGGKRLLIWAAAAFAGLLFLGGGIRVLADCASFGLPFTDLGATGFCAQIAEAYYSGLSNGTSATTYSPTANVPREQMAAFVTRTLDQSLQRGSRRAALAQWWSSTPHYDSSLGVTAVGSNPFLVQSDGADVWVANNTSATVSRVRASDGKLLDTWTGATSAYGVLVAMGRVFVTGSASPGNLYLIDPTQPAGPVTSVASTLGNTPQGIAFDGNKIWTANFSATSSGSVSIVTPGGAWAVTTVTTGFSEPAGAVFDGTNIWVTDDGDSTLKKLDSNGAILQSVSVGSFPQFPVFDGRNIWVPNRGDSLATGSLTVVRVSDGAVLKTFSAGNGNQNGMNFPMSAAFDGQRILVTNGGGASVSLFKATDLSIIGTILTAGVAVPFGACSDGVNFWVSFFSGNKVGRF